MADHESSGSLINPPAAAASAESQSAPTFPAQDSEAVARLAAEACDDRKAVDIRLIRIDEISYLADWFVICTGLTDVQVRAIGRSVEERLELEAGRLPLRREGQTEGRWLLLDYGDVIVHILTPQERSYYDLESFWGHGQQIHFQPASGPASMP